MMNHHNAVDKPGLPMLMQLNKMCYITWSSIYRESLSNTLFALSVCVQVSTPNFVYLKRVRKSQGQSLDRGQMKRTLQLNYYISINWLLYPITFCMYGFSLRCKLILLTSWQKHRHENDDSMFSSLYNCARMFLCQCPICSAPALEHSLSSPSP